jgi:hypothetical protein
MRPFAPSAAPRYSCASLAAAWRRPIDCYAIEGQRHSDWLAKGALKYDRRRATTLNAPIDAGFRVCRVEEFAPTQIAAQPELAEELERPTPLVAAQR